MLGTDFSFQAYFLGEIMVVSACELELSLTALLEASCSGAFPPGGSTETRSSSTEENKTFFLKAK